MRSRTGPIILAIAVLAAAAACDSKPTSRQSSSPSSTQATGQHEQHGQHQGAAKATTPEGLAAELQQYFAVHTLLALRQTRSVVTGNAAYREADDHELEE